LALLKVAEAQYKFDPGSATQKLVEAFEVADTAPEILMDAVASCSIPFPQKILATMTPSIIKVKLMANLAEITLKKLVPVAE